MIITPNKFALLIEDMVKNKRMSYMDVIIEYCSENGIDPSNTKGLINKTLKEKIAYEAQSLKYVKRKNSKVTNIGDVMIEIVLAAYAITIVGGVLLQAQSSIMREYIVDYHTFKFRVGDSEEKGGCTFVGEWKDVTSRELFSNKKIVMFSLLNCIYTNLF